MQDDFNAQGQQMLLRLIELVIFPSLTLEEVYVRSQLDLPKKHSREEFLRSLSICAATGAPREIETQAGFWVVRPVEMDAGDQRWEMSFRSTLKM